MPSRSSSRRSATSRCSGRSPSRHWSGENRSLSSRSAARRSAPGQPLRTPAPSPGPMRSMTPSSGSTGSCGWKRWRTCSRSRRSSARRSRPREETWGSSPRRAAGRQSSWRPPPRPGFNFPRPPTARSGRPRRFSPPSRRRRTPWTSRCPAQGAGSRGVSNSSSRTIPST